jgi:hypothetical protein
VEGVDAMGRGRQKAKQTKVARKLKYFSPDTDLEALQRELASGRGDSDDDLYAKYADLGDQPQADDFDGDEDSEGDQHDYWSPASSEH